MHDALFSAASLAAVLGWLLLAAAAASPLGRWRPAALAAGGRVVPLALCGLYAGLLAWHWGSAPGGGFGSLAAVQALFAVPGKMLGGWVHYLAFDLLVGRWITDDVLDHGRPRVLLLPALPATFLYGPLGLGLYLLARRAASRRTA